jgi:L-ascorbate metabolism protein UlaG (beta-lactamase superfamily)
MRKVLITIAGALVLILLALSVAIWMNENDKAVIEKYIKNENLPTVKTNWKGTPVDEKDRFVNAEFPFLPKISDLLKWQTSGNPQKEEKQSDTARLEVRDPTEFLQNEQDGILWLGHAGFFVRLAGKSILIDAIFEKPPLVKIYVDVPSPIEKIRRVDYLLVSHDHRDHCDEETIRQITQKFPEAEILGGLGMEDIFSEWKTPSNRVQTAAWYQQFALPDEQLKIFFLPVRHWSRRGLFDTNKRLWGAFVIQSQNQTIYFSGDSGYGSHYKEVGELFPKIDYFLIGIGAYKPVWFMKPNHNSPADALQGFIDSKAERLIPMHYGRFDLSDEPPGEPLRLLREKAQQVNISDKIKALNINESLSFFK